jgi:uncharacterized protein
MDEQQFHAVIVRGLAGRVSFDMAQSQGRPLASRSSQAPMKKDTPMVLDNHSLARDFPEFKDKIHQLKQSNHHFARLNTDYEDIDKAVIRLETGVEHGSDAELESKKLRRVQLKDELYAMLKA